MTARLEADGVGGHQRLPDYGELLDLARRAPAWHADAACREHPELEFVPRNTGRLSPATLARLRAVCAACLVVDQCRAWAAAQGPDLVGVFAGQTEQDRNRARPPRVPDCGTMAGYRHHRKRGEKPCPLCRRARSTLEDARRG